MKTIIILLAILLTSPAFASEADNICKKPTFEETLNCLSNEYKSANKELETVLSAIKTKHSDDELFTYGFNKAQSDWEVSFKSNCNSIYNLWRYGSVKDIKWLECKIELTKQRLEFLNNNYGASADGA